MGWILLIYPWLELLSLIQLGVETNALFALGWVFAMFFLGGALLRHAGTASVMRLREAQAGGLLHEQVLVDDAVVALAGVLLVIPGLVSDFFALIVLIGPLRRALARLLGLRTGSGRRPTGGNSSEKNSHGPVTLEGEFTQLDDQENDSGR